MKHLTILTTLVFVMLIQSCTTTTKTSVFWVNAQKTDCSAGAGKMKCLLVHRGDDLANPEWENFYANIEGFEFEEGFLQKIEVKEEQLDLENVPADASSIQYTLIKVLEKQPHYQSLLNGSWVLQRINDTLVNEALPVPNLSIDLSNQQVSGTDGCNNYTATIVNINSSKIELGNIASTKKMCADMSTAAVYNKVLSSIATFYIKGYNLSFYNSAGNKVLTFLKED